MKFQPTPSSRRETNLPSRGKNTRKVSTHSLLAEGDQDGADGRARAMGFNPLPPRGGRPVSGLRAQAMAIRVSTHSLLAEGDAQLLCVLGDSQRVSTHSLLAEGDRIAFHLLTLTGVSTHSLLAEGDPL